MQVCIVIFGEPDIDILPAGKDQIRVKVKGVDVFRPQTGKVERDNADAFDKPKSGRIAVKVINHLGDEVMKVFKIT